MGKFLDGLLEADPFLVCAVVSVLVFAEDAAFIGFILPGETAAVFGGAVASRGHVPLWVMIALVVAAAVLGDTVGYVVGRRLGPAIERSRLLRSRRDRLARAKEFLRVRGGWAVVLGRFTAFLRAVMPALAGAARMPYATFATFNAVGGLVWGSGFVVLGYLAGGSYEAVAKAVGRDATAIVLLAGAAAWGGWRLRRWFRSRGAASARRRRTGGP